MPRNPEQLAVMREESRARILDAALRLFAAHGYDGTPVRAIAEEAGVSQGLLYNYFDGKEGLLRAILQRSMADVVESFRRAESGSAPSERLEQLIRASFAIVAENLPFWRLTYQIRMQPGVVEALGDGLPASVDAIRDRLERLLEASGVPEPGIQARVLFAAIDGAAQHFALDPDHYPVERVAEALTERFRPSLSGRPSGSSEEP
jgi:AcrR family transcriptional regulator